MIRRLAHQLCPPVVTAALRRVGRRLEDPRLHYEEDELQRLAELPSMQPATTNLPGWPFHVLDGRSFVALYHTLFKRTLYQFDAGRTEPMIIDCGANIGVSVAWWKVQYPKAHVLAFEADPTIFGVLQKNCGHLPDVTLVNAAVWDRDGQASFLAKGGGGGHLAEFSERAGAVLPRSVPCVRLRTLLTERCDLLKMDIEGAEVDVIRDCADALRNVDRLFVEYHSFTDRKQHLGSTVSCLEHAGFRIHVHVEIPSPRPFLELLELNEKDLRLDLFCFRGDAAPRLKRLSHI